MQIFPADSIDVEMLIRCLHGAGFLQRYSDAKGKYIQIVNFARHQNPHKAEKASELPAASECEISTVQAPCKNSSNRADSFISDSFISDSLISDSLVKRYGSSVDEPSSKKPKQPKGYSDDFERIWLKRPRRAGSDPKKSAFQAMNARLKDGATLAEIEAGVERYCKYLKATGSENTEFVQQFATFLGPDEHFRDPWTIPVKQRSTDNNDDARESARAALFGGPPKPAGELMP